MSAPPVREPSAGPSRGPEGDGRARPAALEAREPWQSILRPLDTVGTDRATRPKRVGGKATTLARLVREGFAVPRGWVLDGRHFTRLIERSLPRGFDLATLLKLGGDKAGIDRAARARDLILATPLPDEIRAAVEALWRNHEADAPWGFAVRSSATCEDVDESSLAGLATTVLGVRGPDALGQAIQQVWASAVLPRALAYLTHVGVRDLSMAVVLQVVVRAEAAGVLFTGPPPGLEGEHWRENERLVNATYGLGAPVVEGAVTADTVRFAADGGAVVDTVTAHKTRALVVGPQGLVEALVPATMTDRPALGDDELRQLADVAARLERAGGGPFDVEFAVEVQPDETRRVFVLQARRVLGGGYPEGGDAETVWSRANVGEALPGAATPLTWSIARSFSDRGFREAFSALGCHVPKGAVLVGYVQSRFYLNLTEFMRIAAQVPGLSPRALLSVSGGAGAAAIALLDKQAALASSKSFLLRLPLTAPRLLLQQARLAREVETFEESAARARRRLFDLDLGLLPDDALATTLKDVRALLDRTGTLMLRCASSSLAAHLVLCAALARAGSRRAPARHDPGAEPSLRENPTAVEHLAQTLVGGLNELESAEPGIALLRVAEVARHEPAAQRRLVAGDVRGPTDLPEGPTRRALETFLDEYGDRAVREAELMTPRWREEPGQVVAMLTAALRGPPSDPEQALARARSLADREMARLETRVSPVELVLVRAIVGRTQGFTRLRERMRGWVTRVLGMLRVVALDIDRRLRRIDPSLREGSVFFCTYDELRAALASGRAEVGHLVRLRHAEFVRDASRPDPPPTFIGRPPPVTLPPVAGTRLVGLPASAGVVEGRARVLAPGAPALDGVEAGEILVSRTTDVGLSPLFLVAAAVVTELGGPLSHAALVAREYGIPAVVNVPGATAAIRTGDRLRVDGDRGIVERLDDSVPPRSTRGVPS